MAEHCFIEVTRPLIWEHRGEKLQLLPGRYEASSVTFSQADEETRTITWVIRAGSQSVAMSSKSFEMFEKIGAIRRD